MNYSETKFISISLICFFTFHGLWSDAQNHNELKKIKRYEISNSQIQPNWKEIIVGFYTLDSIEFQNSVYRKSQFTEIFTDYLNQLIDTTVILFDYKEHLTLNKLSDSRKLIYKLVKNYKNGQFYFSNYQSQIVSKNMDTMQMDVQGRIFKNELQLTISDFKNYLVDNQLKQLVFCTDSETPISHLYEVLEIGRELRVSIMLITK